jgi:hypothetical protein
MKLGFGILSVSLGDDTDPSYVALTIHSALFATVPSPWACNHLVRCSHLFGFMIQLCGQLPIKSQNAQGMSMIESIVE